MTVSTESTASVASPLLVEATLSEDEVWLKAKLKLTTITEPVPPSSKTNISERMEMLWCLGGAIICLAFSHLLA